MVWDHDALGAAYQRLFRPHSDNRVDYYPPKIVLWSVTTGDAEGGFAYTRLFRS